MTLTVRDWISGSMRLLGVLAAGETVGGAEAADALQIASELLDQWAGERLTIYTQTRSANNSLVSSQQDYTIGTGGNWTQERPIWIDGAMRLTAGLEYPLKVFTRDEWQAISNKAQTATYPEGIFYNPTFPLGTVSVWPIPTDSASKVVLYTPIAPIKSVSSLDTALSIPEGWAKALRYNLAVDLAPEYPSSMADPGVFGLIAEQAVETKAGIKRNNQPLDELQIDPALRPQYGRWSNSLGDFR